MKATIKIAPLFFVFSDTIFNCAHASENQLITIKLDSWTAEINPETLEVTGKLENSIIPIANTQQNDLGKISNLTSNSDKSSWVLQAKEIFVEVVKKENQLVFTFKSQKEQILSWPSTLNNKENKSIILPDKEGIIIPVSDTYLLSQIQKYNAYEYSMRDLSMPFFANINENSTATFITNSPLRNTVRLLPKNKKLYAAQEHSFEAKGHFAPYIVSISLTKGTNPIQPALIFRQDLIENKQFKSLKQKEKENPNIKKLYGAMHAYTWGTGRTIETLNLLSSLGIKHMWIGYDVGEISKDKFQAEKKYIEKAKALGFLVGPYDTWANVQNPKTSDTPLSIYPNAWPNAAVMHKNGKKQGGFGNRGYEASSEYFALQKPQNKDLKERATKFISTGINSYFLDVDATGDLYDDYSKDHPTDMQKDLENRITRMKILSETNSMVTGSETAAYWAVPYIAFAHGNISVFNNPHWKLTKNKKFYGRWWPNDRPDFFFKSIDAPKDYDGTKFNPIYRIPLFQAAYHDSIVTTDRWEIPITKFKNSMQKRVMLETLYGVPSIWSLDVKEIKEYSATMKKQNNFFAPYHEKIATLPLTKFEWLTRDKLIQQTQFGDIAIVTANFSDKKYKDLPSKSIEVLWVKENKKELFTP